MTTHYDYSREPEDGAGFTEKMDQEYNRFAGLYARAVRVLPLWQRWLETTLPHIRGPRVLEASTGTGSLLPLIASRHPDVVGIDFNRKMVDLTSEALRERGLDARVTQADIADLPFPDASFDSVVCTMAFSGYPDGLAAMTEMRRVLDDEGVLLLIDPAPPSNGNWLGTNVCRFWQRSGDIIRDMPALFDRVGFDIEDLEIGGFGAIHLWVARPR